jgi:hypothetical protein
MSPESQAVLELLNTYYTPHCVRTHYSHDTHLMYWWAKNLPWENSITGVMPMNIQDMVILEMFGEDNPNGDDDDPDGCLYDPEKDYNPEITINTSLWPLFYDSSSCMSLLGDRYVCSFISELAIRRMALFLVDKKFTFDSEVLLLEEHKMLHPLALKAFNYLWENPTIQHRSRAFLQVAYFASNVVWKAPKTALTEFRKEMMRNKLYWTLPRSFNMVHLDLRHLRGVEKILHVMLYDKDFIY